MVVEDRSVEVVEVEVEAVPDVEGDSEAAVEAPVSNTPKLYWDWTVRNNQDIREDY